MHETGINSRAGRHWNCRGTISRPRGHDSPRQQDHDSICPRCILDFRCGSGESQVSVKAGSVTERGDITTQSKKAGPTSGPFRLAKLLRGVETKGPPAHSDLEIQEIAYDSRKVKSGTLFFAIRGEKTDGNNFVADAVARGAIAIASEQPIPGTIPVDFPWIQVANARKALAIAAANYFGRPAEVLKLVGITGTNGKTT